VDQATRYDFKKLRRFNIHQSEGKSFPLSYLLFFAILMSLVSLIIWSYNRDTNDNLNHSRRGSEQNNFDEMSELVNKTQFITPKISTTQHQSGWSDLNEIDTTTDDIKNNALIQHSRQQNSNVLSIGSLYPPRLDVRLGVDRDVIKAMESHSADKSLTSFTLNI